MAKANDATGERCVAIGDQKWYKLFMKRDGLPESNVTAFLESAVVNLSPEQEAVQKLYRKADKVLSEYGTETNPTDGTSEVHIYTPTDVAVGDTPFRVDMYKRTVDAAGPFRTPDESIAFNFSSSKIKGSLADVIIMKPSGDLTVVRNTDGDPMTTNGMDVDVAEDIRSTELLVLKIEKNCRSEKDSKEWALERRRDRRNEIAAKVGKRVGVFALSACAVSGGILGFRAISWDSVALSDGERFDNHHYSLTDGAVVSVGETGTPEYSEKLRLDSHLGPDKVPEVRGYEKGNSGPYDDELTMDDGFRQITITSSKEGFPVSHNTTKPNCDTEELEETIPADAKVKVWTDFVDANGHSRADELSVGFTLDSIKYCWSGLERNSADDPRLVFDIITER
jgi:hypothetical protein